METPEIRSEGVTVRRDDVLATAASRMMTEQVTSLAVVQRGRLVGVLTETDIVKAVADGVDTIQTTVDRYMIPELVGA